LRLRLAVFGEAELTHEHVTSNFERGGFYLHGWLVWVPVIFSSFGRGLADQYIGVRRWGKIKSSVLKFCNKTM
jgi:hypothetical protein